MGGKFNSIFTSLLRFDPAFLAALDGGEEAIRALVQKEHPDAEVYSFPFWRPSFARLLLAEAAHFNASGLTNPKPNGMNNYGLLWNHLGDRMEAMFRRVQRDFLGPVAAALFPHLGGGSLDHHHSYLVRFAHCSEFRLRSA